MDRHTEALKKLAEGVVIPANPLALTENGEFDEKRQRAIVRYYLDAGVGGLAVAVHTTQFEIRLPQYNLLEKVLNVAKEEAEKFERKHNKTIVMVAGVCGCTEQATNEAHLAKKLGYDAVLLSPGGLNDKSEEYMLDRTREVAKIMPVIGFYLQTAVGGRVFTYDYWEKLCEIDNVVAIKAAPFNRYFTLDVVRAAALSSRKDKITLYTGNDDNIVLDLVTTYSFEKDGVIYKKGFTGGLLGHWSVWTKKAVELFDALKEVRTSGKISPEILTLATKVTDTNAVLFDTANGFKGCIAGLHEVLHRQGLFTSLRCLDLNEKMSDGQLEEIDRIYRQYPELNDDDFVKENINRWLED